MTGHKRAHARHTALERNKQGGQAQQVRRPVNTGIQRQQSSARHCTGGYYGHIRN